MTTAKKLVTSTLLLMVLSLGGCMLFMRSCLSKYDQRSAIPPILLFEKNGKQILLAIVKFDKTTSYSTGRGMTNKSIRTTYFLQSNDGITGAKLQEQKLKEHIDIKEYPIEMIGAANGFAWMFVGELMAFDPFTLEKKADMGILENRNPQLKEKLPKERKYYKFDRHSGTILITATDGSKWQLNLSSLQATEINSTATNEADFTGLEAIKKQLDDIKNEIAVAAEQDYKRQSGLSIKVRQAIYEQRNILTQKRDSLTKIKFAIEKTQRSARDQSRVIEALQEVRMNLSYNQIKVNSDTLKGKLYGLYSIDEFRKAYDRFEYRSEADETSRRNLLIASVTLKNNYLSIDTQNPEYPNATQWFLHGGFLIDKQTGKPMRLPNGWLVVHKTEIGKNGLIQVSAMTNDGKVLWTANPGMPDWLDWFATTQNLYIFGTNNKVLSSSKCNALLIVDLVTGKIASFDYFTDKSTNIP